MLHGLSTDSYIPEGVVYFTDNMVFKQVSSQFLICFWNNSFMTFMMISLLEHIPPYLHFPDKSTPNPENTELETPSVMGFHL